MWRAQPSMCVCAQSCPTLSDPMGCSPPSSSVHGVLPGVFAWGFPGKNPGVCCHFLLQGIFWIQGSNPCLFCLLIEDRSFSASATWETGMQEKLNKYNILHCLAISKGWLSHASTNHCLNNFPSASISSKNKTGSL